MARRVAKKKPGKIWDGIKNVAKKVWDVAKKLPGYVLPSSPIPADAAPGIATCVMYDAKRRHVIKDHDDGLPDSKCTVCKRLTPKKGPRY